MNFEQYISQAESERAVYQQSTTREANFCLLFIDDLFSSINFIKSKALTTFLATRDDIDAIVTWKWKSRIKVIRII